MFNRQLLAESFPSVESNLSLQFGIPHPGLLSMRARGNWGAPIRGVLAGPPDADPLIRVYRAE
jgi:hypothetical protein